MKHNDDNFQEQQLTALKNLWLNAVSGDIDNLLKLCPNVEDLLIEKCHGSMEKKMPSVKKLTYEGNGYRNHEGMGWILKKFEILEELSLKKCKIMFENDDSNWVLGGLKKISLSSVMMNSDTYQTLMNSLDENIDLMQCMINCKVDGKTVGRYKLFLDDDD